ncbi:MAG: hypothetical protein DRI95_14735 [Bacteroidetes bacterium]|nr:MAG: hypothetical protein DRI95_14735 [Bacteroidota bacterium]
MNDFTRLSYILILSFLIIESCKSQNKDPKTQKTEQEQIKKVREYNPKDKKILSAYIDTIALDRFKKEIYKFEKEDSLQPNRIIDIVFVGSSSIRKWENLEKDMKGLRVLNRGFGGSTVPEAIFYSDILILKHKPKKIVIYSGDNDVSTLNSSTKKTIDSYKYLYNLLNSELPNTKIFILSIKPSPARWAFWSQMQEVNNLLKEFCDSKGNCNYIDISSSMIDSTGNLKDELFLKDRIHLNEKGYKLWADIIYDSIK